MLPAPASRIIYANPTRRKSLTSHAIASSDPMKPTPNSAGPEPLLAFGAHPDDIEFACGGVVARETSLGRPAHFVVCSQGESASHGTPEQRAAEAENGAKILGASLEFVDLDGDARLE